MFPIPWNFPFRKKNGNLVNIGDAIDEGTELPAHSEGDAGKVLSVDESGDLEWSDEVNTEIQALSDKLDDEIETRAKLGAHNFFTTKYPGGKGPYTSWTIEANGIRLSNSQASTYCYQQFNQNLQKNTDYTISVDITVTSGTAGIVIKGDDTNILTKLNISGSVKYTFNTGNYDAIVVTFYCVTDTTAVGNVLYDNLLIKLATDKNDTYQPYSMTNRELTEKAIGSIDSIQITTITTAGGSWTATENCWLQANITPPANDGRMAYVRINGITVITIGGQSEETPLSVGTAFPVFKGDVITTRDIGTYNLVFYKMK